MTVAAAILLVFLVAIYVALPLLRSSNAIEADTAPPELWAREKGVALLAIREAEFDHATGKLTEDDYASLRGTYEERALHAMQELDRGEVNQAPPSSVGSTSDTTAQFCTSCGKAFASPDRFCGSCGKPRA
ncbi:MAG: hypothetical protein ACI8TX_001645 [Hyphomicrobiaceae bacterium]